MDRTTYNLLSKVHGFQDLNGATYEAYLANQQVQNEKSNLRTAVLTGENMAVLVPGAATPAMAPTVVVDMLRPVLSEGHVTPVKWLQVIPCTKPPFEVDDDVWLWMDEEGVANNREENHLAGGLVENQVHGFIMRGTIIVRKACMGD
jgi:hypothetical protein